MKLVIFKRNTYVDFLLNVTQKALGDHVRISKDKTMFSKWL